jgi:hypothetical protein
LSLKVPLIELEEKVRQAREARSPQPTFVSHEELTKAWLNGGDLTPAAPAWEKIEVTTLMGDRMNKAEDDKKALMGEANTSAILFGGLGLRLAEETWAWDLENPQVASGFGLFVDCFSILE